MPLAFATDFPKIFSRAARAIESRIVVCTRVKNMITANEDVADKTTISWWSNVDTVWQAAHDAELARIAEAEAQAAEASGD